MGFKALIIATIVALLAGGQAAADVLSIEPDGSVLRYDQPMVHNASGAVAIAPAESPPPIVMTGADGDVAAVLGQAAGYYGVPETLVRAVAWQESRGRVSALSPKGAIGVMQLMPATARQLGVNPNDVTQNIYGGVAYLAQMLSRYQGDVSLALAAYNAGPAAVDRFRGVPPYAETRAYVAAILARLS